MTVALMPNGKHRPVTPPLMLREAELQHGIELFYFGWRDFNALIDEQIKALGLGHAHQRALYFISRFPDSPVNHLQSRLHITKQSLHRILRSLESQDLITMHTSPQDLRIRLIRLTEKGQKAEAILYAPMKERMRQAYLKAGPQAVQGFWDVLEALRRNA